MENLNQSPNLAKDSGVSKISWLTQTVDDVQVKSTSGTNPKNPSTTKRSSRGCLTCKIRKKRCDESKPVCMSCWRLQRKCAYIEDNMSEEEIRILKEAISSAESEFKTRKRKRKCDDDPDTKTISSEGTTKSEVTSSTDSKDKEKTKASWTKKKVKYGKKIVFNPLAMNMASASIPNSNLFPGISSNVKHSNYQPPNNTDETYIEQQNIVKPDGDSSQFKNYIDFLSTENKKKSSFTPLGIPNFSSDKLSSLQNEILTQGAFSPTSFINALGNSGTPNAPEIPMPNIEENVIPQPLYPLNQYNQQQSNTTTSDHFMDIFPTNFSKLLQDHFKFEDSMTYPHQPTDLLTNGNLLDQMHDAFKLSPRFDPGEPLQYNEVETQYTEQSNVSEQPEQKIIEVDKQESTEKKENTVDISKILMKYNKTTPELYVNPSIVQNSTLATLSDLGKTLYQYYRDKLSFIVCSAPKTENMYLNTFLPMAHVDKSVLYGILAWSAFHMGGEKMENQGNYYIKLALENFSKRPILPDDFDQRSEFVYDDVDETDENLIKEPKCEQEVEDNADLEISQLNRDNMINMRLAAFLILCGVEICKGDVSRWSKYLTYGAELIKLKGGLKNFSDSKDEHFLVTNYAYHDITAIQVINEKNIHFDLKEYEEMWSKSNELGFTDPLHGISSPVFKILAEINTLVIEVQKIVKRTKKNDKRNKNVSDSPINEKVYGLDEEDYWNGAGMGVGQDFERSSITSSIDEMLTNGVPSTISDEWIEDDLSKRVDLDDLTNIMQECQNIEQRIANVRPKISSNVTDKELELQLTIFECFQITAKIHLRQSVLRLNSASIEIQFLTNQLIKLLDILLGSEFEACLCLPMFIAGMNCVTKNDRIDMTKRFEAFIERYKWKNVSRCQIVIKYIWKLNCKGEKFVDWYAVVRTLGWDLSFA